jgi:thymidylate kinase
MMWSNHQATALKAVFTSLNDNRVEWMVLRNYKGLPYENIAKDIDLMIKTDDYARAKNIVVSTLIKHQFNVYQESNYPFVSCFTFFNIQDDSLCSIKIDLLDGFGVMWRGARIVDFADLYTHRSTYSDFFVPNASNDGFMLWIKTLLPGGFIKTKYRPIILDAIQQHPDSFQHLLTKAFGKQIKNDIWSILASGNLDATIPFQQRLRSCALKLSFRNHPKHTILTLIKTVYYGILRRSYRHKPSMLAVVGPDGAGKTTFIELLQQHLCNILIKDAGNVLIQHFRPNILPNIKKLLSGKNYDESKEEFTSPHRAKPASSVSSFLRLTYYWLDYLLGYWLQTRRRCIAGKVYVFDRYFYDFIVDPYRSRIKLPQWLRLLFLKITPEPDVVFFLDCDAATIYGRKQELREAEIERQLQAYRTLTGISGRFITLDARKHPKELCNDAVRLLIEKSFTHCKDAE